MKIIIKEKNGGREVSFVFLKQTYTQKGDFAPFLLELIASAQRFQFWKIKTLKLSEIAQEHVFFFRKSV